MPGFVQKSSDTQGAARAILVPMGERRDTPQYSPPDLAELGRRLAETYTRGAEVLEQTAGLAEAHGDWEEQQGRTGLAATERAHAAWARDAAARFRTNAHRLR